MKNTNATHSYYRTKNSEQFLISVEYKTDSNGCYNVDSHKWSFNEESILPFQWHLPQEVEKQLIELTGEEIQRVEIELRPINFVDISKEEILED